MSITFFPAADSSGGETEQELGGRGNRARFTVIVCLAVAACLALGWFLLDGLFSPAGIPRSDTALADRSPREALLLDLISTSATYHREHPESNIDEVGNLLIEKYPARYRILVGGRVELNPDLTFWAMNNRNSSNAAGAIWIGKAEQGEIKYIVVWSNGKWDRSAKTLDEAREIANWTYAAIVDSAH